MADESTNPPKSRAAPPGLPPLVWVAAAAAVLGAVAFYWWVGVHHKGEKVAWWGILGDSAGPVSAVFNAGALLAALWAVHLQRQELHETRQEMKEQRKEFERSATAQETLIRAQSLAAMATARLGMIIGMSKEREIQLGYEFSDQKRLARLGDAVDSNIDALEALNGMAADLIEEVRKQ